MKAPFAILIAAMLVSCSQTIDQGSLKSEIERANQAFMQAVSDKSADAVGALYTENARLMFPNMPTIQGRENIKGFFLQAIESGISGIKLTTEEVAGTNDLAVELGRYEMLAGGQTVDEGKYMVEWKKVDGKWLLHKDMPSTDLPAAQSGAKVDETVGISVFQVKEGSEEEFETFVRDVLTPAADISTPEKSHAVKAIRLLREKTPAKNGMQKFIFIFDPMFKEMDYGIESTLIRKHGEKRGKELMSQFESMTTPFYEYHDMRVVGIGD